jgi:hypothetical protein
MPSAFMCLLIGAVMQDEGRTFDLLLQWLSRTRCVIKLKVMYTFWDLNQVVTKQAVGQYFANRKVENGITQALRGSRGVHVLAGPPGTGKSTALGEAIRSFRRANPTRKVAVMPAHIFTQDNAIHMALGVPSWSSLSEYVPAGSVIVIDDLDIFPERLAKFRIIQYMMELARDSYNSGKYQILLVVSDPTSMKALFAKSTGREIGLVCNPADLKWSREQLHEYVSCTLLHWARRDQAALLVSLVYSTVRGCPINAGRRRVMVVFPLVHAFSGLQNLR